MPDLLEQLGEALGAAHVVRGPAVAIDYTHDEALTADPVTPLAVVFPGSTDDVVTVLRWANEHRIPVVARGSGTGLSGGCLPVSRRHRALLRPHAGDPGDRPGATGSPWSNRA